MRQFCTTQPALPLANADAGPGRRRQLVRTSTHFLWRTTMGFLAGKKLLITGVLSNRSIAYGIAKACHAQGAELAFSYVGERFKDRITEFAAEFDSKLRSEEHTSELQS